MKYSIKTKESIARWQELREKNYLRAQKAIENGQLDYAGQFQELHALCHEEVMKHMGLDQ